jgi:hypothetical protein
MPPAMVNTLRRMPRALRIGLGCIAFIFVVPFQPITIDDGLDPSWVQSLHVAAEMGLQYGEQIIFTYGPLGFAQARTYWPGLFPATLLYWVAIASALLLTLPIQSQCKGAEDGALSAAIVLAVAMASTYWPEALVFALVSSVVCYSAMPAAKRSVLAFASGVLGLVALAKLTFLASGVFALCAVAVILLRLGRPFLGIFLSAVFLATFTAGWLLARQELRRLPQFFDVGLEIVFGYGEAMALKGYPWEPLSYALVSIGAVSPMLFVAIRRADYVQLTLGMFVSGMFLLLLMQGFTRHDQHALALLSG